MRQELFYDKGQTAYESTPVVGTADADVDEPLVERYRALLGAPSVSRLLDVRGLSRVDGLKVAGVLLFGRDPEKYLPNSHVRVTRFLGRARHFGEQRNVVSDHRVEGPIPQVVPAVQERVRSLQPRRRGLGGHGRFEDVALVPEDVWLEAIVNAVVHRLYSSIGDHIHVDIFDDRIEVESPGRFPGIVDVSDTDRMRRFARNPRIARVCADLSLGQEFGEGVRRMHAEMPRAGLGAPLYRQTSGSVRVTLSGEPVEQGPGRELPDGARIVMQALREAGRLSTGDLATAMSVGRPAALRRLNLLREEGPLTWNGTSARDPHASWTLPHR